MKKLILLEIQQSLVVVAIKKGVLQEKL